MRQGHFSVCKQFYSFFSRSVSFITHETRRMEAACARDIGLMRVFPVRQGWRTLPPEATLTPARPVPWGRAGVRANEPPKGPAGAWRVTCSVCRRPRLASTLFLWR